MSPRTLCTGIFGCLLCKAAVVAGERPLPPWTYGMGHGATPGIAWFGGNETGFENEHQLSFVFQNYSMVAFGWQSLLTAPSNYTGELSLLVEQCQIVKKRLVAQGYPDTPVIVYCDNLRVQPFYRALRKVMRDPQFEDFFLRNPGRATAQGGAGYIPATTYCLQMRLPAYDPRCLCWYWNLFNETAIDYYLNELLLTQISKPGFDGVFFDGSDGFMRGTWKEATNVPADLTDRDALQAVISFHKKAAELLRRHGKFAIFSEHLADTTPEQQVIYADQMADTGYARFYEGFHPSPAYIDAILNETQPPVQGHDVLPVVLHASSADETAMVDAFATFLVVRSQYSYFMASRGWTDAGWTWHPIYDLDVGEPLGPAMKHGSIGQNDLTYTRQYSNCNVTVACRGSAVASTAPPVSPEAESWDCKLVNCSCDDFAKYYGTHPGRGFGCAPVAAQDWWKHEQCDASAGAEKCCGGPACRLPNHAPCICPPPAPSPSQSCSGIIRMKHPAGYSAPVISSLK